MTKDSKVIKCFLLLVFKIENHTTVTVAWNKNKVIYLVG